MQKQKVSISLHIINKLVDSVAYIYQCLNGVAHSIVPAKKR